jgi:hypothetical protein
MALYDLLGFQHFMGYLFVGLLFLLIFGLALGYVHFRNEQTDQRMTEITGHFQEGLQDRNAPFPLFMVLIIIGVVIWGFFYIYLHGLLGVKI